MDVDEFERSIGDDGLLKGLHADHRTRQREIELMKNPLSLIATAIVAGVAFLGASAQQTAPASDLNVQALNAYRAKQYDRFLHLEQHALALDPSNARLIYNVAAGEALLANAGQAVSMLDRLLSRKLDFGADTDPDFARIRATPQWSVYREELAQLRVPIVRSSRAFTLNDRSLIATGIAVDANTNAVYIASALERKILRRAADGTVSFVAPGQDGFAGGASLAIDAPRHLLYATTSSPPFMNGYRPQDAGRTGVFAFDLSSGKTVRRVWLPASGGHHLLNALAVDDAGYVYVSDTGESGIYVLGPRSSAFRLLVPQNFFAASQGLALSPDGRTLYVADWTSGIWALDLRAVRPRRIDAPPSAWLQGLDGITRVPDRFVAVQIGVAPQRVLHIHLDKQFASIIGVDILEMNHPDYSGPVQGTMNGGAFWYIANSQLPLVDPNTNRLQLDKARSTVVLKLPIRNR